MYLDDAATAISGFEGRILWMYLDTRGNVTVGVGRLLSTAATASMLPFRHQGGGAIASAAAIMHDYAQVSTLKPRMVATAYRCALSLWLADDVIDGMIRIHHCA